MIIKFLGVKGEQRKSGCPVCGSRVRTSNTLTFSKRMILPSNRVMIFVLNHEYEVSQQEGEFLLQYHYHFNGKELYPFARVK